MLCDYLQVQRFVYWALSVCVGEYLWCGHCVKVLELIGSEPHGHVYIQLSFWTEVWTEMLVFVGNLLYSCLQFGIVNCNSASWFTATERWLICRKKDYGAQHYRNLYRLCRIAVSAVPAMTPNDTVLIGIDHSFICLLLHITFCMMVEQLLITKPLLSTIAVFYIIALVKCCLVMVQISHMGVDYIHVTTQVVSKA